MPSEHEKLVQRVYDAFARRDPAAILESFSPEVEYVQTDLLPWGGRYHGLAGVQMSLGKLFTNIDSRIQPEEMFSAGDQVVVIGRTRGTIRESGASFDLRVVHVWTVVNGTIRRLEVYLDTPAMLVALKGP